MEWAYGMGDNTWGQLGKDPEYFQFIPALEKIEPVCIQNLPHVIQDISVGAFHSLLLVQFTRTDNR